MSSHIASPAGEPENENVLTGVINLDEAWVVLSDGTQLPIVMYMDAEGVPIEEMDEAVIVLAGDFDFGYVEIKLSAIELVTLH